MAKEKELTMESLLKKLEEMEQKLEKAEKKTEDLKEVQESVLTSGQKQAMLEKNLQMAMVEAKKDTVKVMLPVIGANDEEDAFVGVNGVRWQIRRGEEVEVPRCVAEVFRNAEMQKAEARNRRKALQNKAEKE